MSINDYINIRIESLVERDTVKQQDVDILNNIIDVLPFEVSLDNGAWLCGGIPRRLLCGHNLWDNDIDFYFRSLALMDEAGAKLSDEYHVLPQKSVFSDVGVTTLTFNYEKWQDGDPLKIQLMSRSNNFTSLDEVLNSFDYTCCMAATDGKSIKLPIHALMDIEGRKLNTFNLSRITPNRLKKYMDMGFNPTYKCIENFQTYYREFKNPNIDWENIDTRQNTQNAVFDALLNTAEIFSAPPATPATPRRAAGSSGGNSGVASYGGPIRVPVRATQPNR